MIALKKKPQATKCSDHRTISLIAHTAKIVAKILRRRTEKKIGLSPILFNLYSEYLTKEALEGLGDFKIGRQIIHTVKYADDLVLLAREEKVLQDMFDKLIEIGRCYGMAMNVEKTKVMRISRQPLPVKIMIDQKKTGECGIF
jgi:hypothetical protein